MYAGLVLSYPNAVLILILLPVSGFLIVLSKSLFEPQKIIVIKRATDKILRVDGPDNIVMITAKNRTVRNVVRLQRTDLHIMNRRSIIKHLDSFFENGITL
mgnify:CR=1 FL=1